MEGENPKPLCETGNQKSPTWAPGDYAKNLPCIAGWMSGKYALGIKAKGGVRLALSNPWLYLVGLAHLHKKLSIN